MANYSLKKSAALLAASALIMSSPVANEYILADFETDNPNYMSDVMNYNLGAWYLYTDEAPSWFKSTFDPAKGYYTDPKGMLEGGSSRFTHISGKEIGEIGFDTVFFDNGKVHEIKKAYPNVVADDGIGKDGSRGISTTFVIDEEVRPQWDHHDDLRYNNFVGIGTGLMPDGKFAILEEGMTISFWAKADLSETFAGISGDPLIVKFSVSTDQPLFEFRDWSYSVQVEVTEEWQQFNIKLQHEHDSVYYFDKNNHNPKNFRLGQSWASRNDDIWVHEFDEDGNLNWVNLEDVIDAPERHFWGFEAPDVETFARWAEAAPKWERSTKLQWSVEAFSGSQHSPEINPDIIGDPVTLFIDHVTISNYTPTFEDQLSGDKIKVNPSDLTEDNSMIIWEKSSANYIGADGNGLYTYVSDGSYKASTIKGKEGSNTGISFNADSTEATIEFELGDIEEKVSGGRTISISPYVGLAMEMNDNGVPFNAVEAGYNGIAVRYKTTGSDIEWLQVRMSDDNVLKGDGSSFSVKVPGTKGEWSTVSISFEDLNLPWWDSENRGTVFNPTAIKTIEFAYEGRPGDKGLFTLDNVWFVNNASKNTPDITDIVIPDNSALVNNFGVTFAQNNINLTLPQGVSAAEIQLYSVTGRLVSSQTVSSATAAISTANLAPSTYILKAVSLDGAAASLTRLINIR